MSFDDAASMLHFMTRRRNFQRPVDLFCIAERARHKFRRASPGWEKMPRPSTSGQGRTPKSARNANGRVMKLHATLIKDQRFFVTTEVDLFEPFGIRPAGGSHHFANPVRVLR